MKKGKERMESGGQEQDRVGSEEEEERKKKGGLVPIYHSDS